jgi:hypothetical protein
MKAIIQSHFPERKINLRIIIADLLDNGLKEEDIILLLDYPVTDKYPVNVIHSDMNMPINWWHSISAILDTDYVALLCDDLTLKGSSINKLLIEAKNHPDIDVFGYEGANFKKTENPYSDSVSHKSDRFEVVDFVIRFYFAKPKTFIKAIQNYHESKDFKIMDDLLLCIGSKCAIVPTTDDSGWNELWDKNVAYSRDEFHYQIRDEVIKKLK